MVKRVLIVEDDASPCEVLKYFLGTRGFCFARVGNGGDAWQFLSGKTKFDLIMSDKDGLDIDGLELLRRVRSDGRVAGIPFVLMVGMETVSKGDLTELEEMCAELSATLALKPIYDFPNLIHISLCAGKVN